jgi:hypothetical protein
MDHPDMALPVDGDAADLTEDPVVRQLLRPGGIDREGWYFAGRGNIRKREDHGCNEDEESSRDACERRIKACAIMTCRHGNLPFFGLRLAAA